MAVLKGIIASYQVSKEKDWEIDLVRQLKSDVTTPFPQLIESNLIDYLGLNDQVKRFRIVSFVYVFVL